MCMKIKGLDALKHDYELGAGFYESCRPADMNGKDFFTGSLAIAWQGERASKNSSQSCEPARKAHGNGYFMSAQWYVQPSRFRMERTVGCLTT